MREGWMEQHFHSGNVTGEIAGLLRDHLDREWYAASVGRSPGSAVCLGPSIGHRAKFWELGGPVDLSGPLRGRGQPSPTTRRTDGWVLIPTAGRKTGD